MKTCDCKEPCEDCKHEEKVGLDDISNVLFSGLNGSLESKAEEPKKEIKQEEKKVSKEQPKQAKKEIPRKLECENTDYKDPVSEEYKLMWNNKMGQHIWPTENRIFTF